MTYLKKSDCVLGYLSEIVKIGRTQHGSDFDKVLVEAIQEVWEESEGLRPIESPTNVEHFLTIYEKAPLRFRDAVFGEAFKLSVIMDESGQIISGIPELLHVHYNSRNLASTIHVRVPFRGEQLSFDTSAIRVKMHVNKHGNLDIHGWDFEMVPRSGKREGIWLSGSYAGPKLRKKFSECLQKALYVTEHVRQKQEKDLVEREQ